MFNLFFDFILNWGFKIIENYDIYILKWVFWLFVRFIKEVVKKVYNRWLIIYILFIKFVGKVEKGVGNWSFLFLFFGFRRDGGEINWIIFKI